MVGAINRAPTTLQSAIRNPKSKIRPPGGGFPAEVIEHQLAHKVPDALGKAYNRTKFIDERRLMMQAWADYLDDLKSAKPGNNIVTFLKVI